MLRTSAIADLGAPLVRPHDREPERRSGPTSSSPDDPPGEVHAQERVARDPAPGRPCRAPGRAFASVDCHVLAAERHDPRTVVAVDPAGRPGRPGGRRRPRRDRRGAAPCRRRRSRRPPTVLSIPVTGVESRTLSARRGDLVGEGSSDRDEVGDRRAPASAGPRDLRRAARSRRSRQPRPGADPATSFCRAVCSRASKRPSSDGSTATTSLPHSSYGRPCSAQ